MNMMPIPQNYKKSVDWILGAYTDAGVSFPNGFQKDAIQNAVGARKTNKFKQFSADHPKSDKIKSKARRSKKYQETCFSLKRELRIPLDDKIFSNAFEIAMK